MSFNLLTSICQFGSFLADRWRAGMFGQMVAPHEPPVTHGTGRTLLTCVGSSVSGQFSERANLLSPTFPATAKGFLLRETKKGPIFITMHLLSHGPLCI